MCTHSRYIYNPYARRSVLVPCGVCPACQQEKALARSNRIRNNVKHGNVCLFVTLTYDNNSVPYVLREDLMSDSVDINVYRDAYTRNCFSSKRGHYTKRILGSNIVDTTYVPFDNRSDSSVSVLPSLKGMSKNKIGVCLYSDFQKFIKRLRQNLLRNYGIDSQFSYFACSEYGSYTKRPHFHTLIFCPSKDAPSFRDSILASWPFADKFRTEKYIEYAKDCASYVSAYVNKHDGILSCLQNTKFEPSHHYSKFFGVVLDCFSLPQILQKIDNRNLFYHLARKDARTNSFVSLPIPAYVINRYFPRFKGFSWFSSSQLFDLLLQPSKIGDWCGDFKIDVSLCGKVIVSDKTSSFLPPLYKYSAHDTYSIFVRLNNAYEYFHKKTGLGRHDYAHYYLNAWNIHSSDVIKHSFDDLTFDDLAYHYENINDVLNGTLSSDLKDYNLDYCKNPNDRLDVVSRSNIMTDLFYKLDKEKRVVNYCMSNLNHLV